jgi:peroxiredoxin
MRPIPLIIILSILTLTGYTQTYDEQAKKSMSNFQDGLNNMPPETRGQVVADRLGHVRDYFIGLKFPAFSLTSIDGKEYQPNDLRGKVVLLNFWFIGCAPCVAEIPMLRQLTEEYQDKDFLLLTFSTDDKESILNFKKENDLNYDVFEKSRELIENKFYLCYGYPTTIILDKEGRIVEFRLGGERKGENLPETFKKIIDAELKR